MEHIEIVENMEVEQDELEDLNLDFHTVERGFKCRTWAEMVKEKERREKEEEEKRAKFEIEGYFVAPNWE
jgi:hypothetical protein